MADGSKIIDLAMQHQGEPYSLGAIVPLTNLKWPGPWDCAEFVSWAAYHAYGIVFAVHPNDIRRGESYSGYWYNDAVAVGVDISVSKAIATPGAILVRKPGAFGIKIGHVAISRGDGTTIEAHSRNVGVAVRQATGRQWSIGVALPGVDYKSNADVAPHQEPSGLLKLENPYMKSPAVEQVQRALAAAGIEPGGIDSEYGPLTYKAVAAFQGREGLLVDGEVGEETARALGLSWPIAS